MTDRQLMQQALEALELLAWYENPATKVQVRKPRNGGPIVTMYPHKVATEAAAPLRERLAQPEQEQDSTCNKTLRAEGKVYPRTCRKCGKGPCIADRVQPEQEPVSGVVLDEHGSAALVKNGSEDWHCKNHKARRLYTTPPQGIYYTPPQRKPLTDAVLAEREACAAMLEANAMACENPIYRSLLQANAQAIREMGQP